MGNHLLRCISTTLLILIAVASNAQVFQTNNQPYKFRGLKAADLLIAPKGCDTTALSNPKWGESTAGALFVDTCNNRLYFYNGLKWNQVTGGGGGVDSFYYNFRNLNDTTLLWDRGDGTVDTLAFSSGGTSLIGSYVDSVTTVGDTLFYWKGGNSTFVTNIATAAAGGDTTIFEIVLDSTGQPNRRVLFSETGNKIGSDNTFLWDKVNNKLVINGTNVSIGGPTAKLVVVGRAVFGVVNTDALQVQALTEVTDTSTYKPMVVDAVGIAYKMNRWPSGSDTTGLGSLYIRNQFATQENKKFSVIQGKVDALDFNATSSIADSTQRLTWDDGNGTLNIGLKGGQVNLAVGQEQVARVYNDAGVTLNDGDIVYITGAQGNRIKVQKAVNTDAAIAYATLGMVTETITAGSEGFVTILGTVNHLNTSSFAEGTELYLSGTAGGYTSTKPAYPAAIVSIGRVERSHATVGSIYVNVRPELPTVASYGKNAGGDSTVLLMSNGQRFAAKDSAGGGGGGGVTTVGTFSGSSQTNGATISGSTITFGPADATNPGMVSTGTQTFEGQKTFNQNVFINSGNSGFPAKLTLATTGSQSYRFQVDTTFSMIVGVPTNKRIDFHHGAYTGGDGNIASFSPTAITFGAPIGGSYSNLTANTTSGPVGGRIYVRDGGTAARYGMGWTGFEYQFTMPSSGRLSFTTNGNIQDGSVNTLFKDNGWVIYGSTKGSQNGDPGARSALTISTTTQGSIPAPIMTETQRNALSSPPSGLRVFNSTTAQPNYRDGSTWQAQAGMTFGTAAPTSTPTAVGNFFLDTTNKKLYVATGTASSADWTILN